MQKFDENQYRREADEIHAPKELVERTRAAMLAEEKRMAEEELAEEAKPQKNMSKKIYRWRKYAVAACVGLFILGGYAGYRYRADNFVHVQQLAALEQHTNEEGSKWNIGMSLGHVENTQEKDDRSEKMKVISGEDRSIVPEGLWEVEKSRIKGLDLYIGYVEKEKMYYAAWEYEGIYYYAEAGNMEENDFLDYLKKNLKNR